jgi:lysophospholipase L1-like esterase
MAKIRRTKLRTIEPHRTIRTSILLWLVTAVIGCGTDSGGLGATGVGGTAAANGGTITASGGTAATNSGGAVLNRGGTTSGGTSSVATGGSTNSVQTGGLPGQGGTGSGGITVQFGGTTANGGTSSEPGGTKANAAGRSSGGVTGIGGSAAGGKAAGGTATGGGTTTGGTQSSGGTKAVGGSGAGATAKGGAAAGGVAGAGTKATGGTTATGGSAGILSPLTIYIAGDSTVCDYTDTAATNDQAGWGQMLHEIFNDKVTIVNRAAGGRTAYWFYLEGAVKKILDVIKPGDYFFIQFGTNDQNETATFTVDGTTYPRYADAQTTFKTQLKQYYLDPTKAKNAIPVLVTPPPRNSAYCNGGNGLGAYATAMIELGAAENVAVVDNNGKTFAYLKAICPKPTTAAAETFFKNLNDTIDGTHFQENGARKMASFIGQGIKEANLGLAAYLL